MAENGIAVYSGDAHGHGKSGGVQRVYFESLDGLIADFDDLCNKARQDCTEEYGGDVPFFIGGHSLGGMIAPLTCLKDQSKWNGMTFFFHIVARVLCFLSITLLALMM
jgi:alpha-beta hydrolase superfamily lysophospholipase